MSFVQQPNDTRRIQRDDWQRTIEFLTAILENVAPTAEKNIRDCLCMIICGDPTPHQVEEMNRTVGDNNGRIASKNVRL